MRKARLLVVIGTLALAGVACGGDTTTSTEETTTAPTETATPTAEATVTATAAETVWTNPNPTITAGGKVTWSWDGSLPHNVAAKDGSWRSGEAAMKGEYVRTFDTVGTYDYLCEFHGASMAGTVTVV